MDKLTALFVGPQKGPGCPGDRAGSERPGIAAVVLSLNIARQIIVQAQMSLQVSDVRGITTG